MPETKIRKPRSNRNFLTIKYKINILKNRAKPVAATDPEVSAFHANGNTGRRTVQPTRPDTFFFPSFPHRGHRSIPAVTAATTDPASSKIRPYKKNTTR